MTALSAILYDFDGTLVDTLPGIEAGIVRAVGAVFPQVELPVLRQYIGPPLLKTLRIHLPDATDTEVEKVATEFKRLYDGGVCLECAVYPGVLETLRHLHNASGVPAFIVTNKRFVPTELLLKHFGMWESFRGLAASDWPQAFGSKAEAMAHILKEHGLDAARALMVGDSRDDFESAQANGVPFVAASYGYGNAAELAPARVLTQFGELPAMVNAFTAKGGGTTP